MLLIKSFRSSRKGRDEATGSKPIPPCGSVYAARAPKLNPSVPRPGRLQPRRGTLLDVKSLRRDPRLSRHYSRPTMSQEQKRIAAALRHGERRRRGLDTAQTELDQIASLLPSAVDAGLTKAQIHELSGVSRPTIDALLHEHRNES
jgi:hypothetical protein